MFDEIHTGGGRSASRHMRSLRARNPLVALAAGALFLLPAAASAQRADAGTESRLNQLQRTLGELSQQLEQLRRQEQQLHQQLEKMRTDYEARLERLEKAPAKPPVRPPAPAKPK